MTYTDKKIIDTYSELFEGLNSISKLELIESLSKSLKATVKSRDTKFYKSFGAFASDKPAEEIINEIKEARKFRKKDLKF